MTIKDYEDNLSEEALNMLKEFLPRQKKIEQEVLKIPVMALIWGASPSSESKLGGIRRELREVLRKEGHLAMYSEELCQEDSKLSIRAQQLIQAQEFDLIISIPGPQGSIAEIHDFTSDNRVRNKILLFLDKTYEHGYSHQSLFAIGNTLGCKIVIYENEDDYETILHTTLKEINSIRECKFLFGRCY